MQTLSNSAWLHYTKDYSNMDTEKVLKYIYI